MSDIVERLRAADIGWSGDVACVGADVAEEAAAEIERLRAEILEMAAIAERLSPYALSAAAKQRIAAARKMTDEQQMNLTDEGRK